MVCPKYVNPSSEDIKLYIIILKQITSSASLEQTDRGGSQESRDVFIT